MRPKKVILIADPDEDRSAPLRFILEVQGFKAIHASNSAAIRALAPTADVVLIRCATLPEGEVQAKHSKSMCRHVPVLLFSDECAGLLLEADGYIDTKRSTLELLERLKCMSARKRGPRKGLVKQNPVFAD